MKFKKLLAFILSLCIVFGMAAIGVSAVDPVSSSSDTVMLHLNSGEVLEIHSSYYVVSNHATWNTLYSADFTGDYILTGEVDYINFHYTSCNVTLHNLDISTSGATSLWSADNITVNLTAKGVNSIISSGSYAIASDINVKLTVADNSSLTVKGGYGYINADSTLTMADGSSLPAVSDDGSLTVSKGTPFSVTHNVTFTALTGGKHKISCSGGDLDYTVDCSNCTYTSVSDDVCKRTCKDCEIVENVEHDYHATDYGSEPTGHEARCINCKHEATRPHTYNNGYYISIDKNYCVKECDECYYRDEVNGLVPHSFKAVFKGNGGHGNVCKHCGTYDSSSFVQCTFDDGVEAPATREYGPSVIYTCNVCKYKKIVPIESKSIIFEVDNFTPEDAGNYGWNGNAVVVYVDGVPTRVITNNGYDTETYSMEYNPASSYVFKWIKGKYSDECALRIYIPGSSDAACKYDCGELESFASYETIYALNCADYTDVDAALAKIPNFLEYYTADSVNNLVTAVKGVKRMLPLSKQAEVDTMAENINDAIDALVSLDSPVPNGVINLTDGKEIQIEDAGYVIIVGSLRSGELRYKGKYVFIDATPDGTKSSSGGNLIFVDNGTIEMDMVNVYIDGTLGVAAPLNIINDAKVTLNPIGINVFDSTGKGFAGIVVAENATLTIADGDGSVLAIGDSGSAGIGGFGGTIVTGYKDCGTVNINGSTVVALSQSAGTGAGTGTGAGIGGGYEGEAGKITINGGVIHAQCLSGGGAGIGCGEFGEGGDIVINGGDIVALDVGNNGYGAGIGGAGIGSIDSITINGGKIIAGSIYGAAIGGGSYSDVCGKITVNGGDISASVHHIWEQNLIGNGSQYRYIPESGNNFVQINGGNINYENSCGISPAPKNKDGVTLEEIYIDIPEEYIGKDIIIILADGTEIEANSSSDSYRIYAPEGSDEGASIILAENRDDDDDNDNDDDVFWLVRMFRAIVNWFATVFQRIGDFFSSIFA